MGEHYIEGKVYIDNQKQLEILLKQQNELIQHQNTILSKMLDIMGAEL